MLLYLSQSLKIRLHNSDYINILGAGGYNVGLWLSQAATLNIFHGLIKYATVHSKHGGTTCSHLLQSAKAVGPYEAVVLQCLELGTCLCSFPSSPLQRSQKRGYTVYSSETFSEQLGGIHLEHSVLEETRAQRVQTRHTPLSASVTWHDTLIRKGQNWKICVKTQIWTFPDYYSSKRLNWVLFLSSVPHFHVGNTSLFGLLPILSLFKKNKLNFKEFLKKKIKEFCLNVQVSSLFCSTDAVIVLEKHWYFWKSLLEVQECLFFVCFLFL